MGIGIGIGERGGKMNKKKFPLEKILTISAKEWLLFEQKNIQDYIAVGIHASCYFPSHKEFQDKIPKNTEVIVSYRMVSGGCYGTALIPR